MSKMTVVTYPYGPGSVTVRIDRIDCILVKPKERLNFQPAEGTPWLMEISANDRWFSIEYATREEADEHRDQLASMMARNAQATVPVEVLV